MSRVAAGPPDEKFGDLLRQLRVRAGLSQARLGELSHVTVRAIGALERGNTSSPHLGTVKQLADALGLAGVERHLFEAAARGETTVAQIPPTGVAEGQDHHGLGGLQFYTWTQADFEAGTRLTAADSAPLPPNSTEPVDVGLLRRGGLPNLQREFVPLARFFRSWIAPLPSRRRIDSGVAARLLWVEGDEGPERSKALLACLALVGRTGRQVCDAGADLTVAAQVFSQRVLASGSAPPPVIAVDLDETETTAPWSVIKSAVANASKHLLNAEPQSPADPYPRIVVAGTEAQKVAVAAILGDRADIEPVDAQGRPVQRTRSYQLGLLKNSDHERVYNRGLPVTARVLHGRRHELTALREAWASPHTRIISIVGYGGTGKSALVNQWLHEMQQKDYADATRVLAWSFYSQGTRETLVAADPFVSAALDWLGDDSPRSLASWVKGERLARLIKQWNFLLVLDGLEPLQHPLKAPHVGGQLTDPSIHTLLTELAKPDWDGLCVITTRVPLTDLRDFESKPDDATPGTVVQLDLENLGESEGADLLQELIGRHGSHAECRQAVREVEGHALAITLLGHYLSDVHGGDLAGRFGLPGLTVEAREGGHARRIMASYSQWLRQNGQLAAVAILLLMGLFDRPAYPDAIRALILDPRTAPLTGMAGVPGSEVWAGAVGALREMGLLNREIPGLPGTLDAHPLVREHFREEIQRDHPELWQQGNRSLFDYYRRVAPNQPADAEGMGLLYASVVHGVAAGLYQEVFDDVLLKRVWRDRRTNYSTRHLGMTSSDLVALSNYFYPRQWTEFRAPTLSAHARTLILTNAGVRLRQLGRLAEARQSFGAIVREIDSRTAATPQDLEDASYAAAQNCELLVIAGKLANGADETETALFHGRRAVAHADRGNDPYFMVHARSALAEVHLMMNELADARSTFEELQAIERRSKPRPRPPFLYSQGLFRYGYFMIETGQANALLEQSRDPEFGRNGKDSSLLSDAIRLLVLGAARRALIEAGHHRKELVNEAQDLLHRAMTAFRAAGYTDYSVRGLLEYAHFHRIAHAKRDYPVVMATLDKAAAEAVRGQMDLLYTDVLLQRAECYLAFWEIMTKEDRSYTRSLLKEVLDESARLVAELGYARRREMLRRLRRAARDIGVDVVLP